MVAVLVAATVTAAERGEHAWAVGVVGALLVAVTSDGGSEHSAEQREERQ
ncbi:MAG: hypothetical protein KTU85_08255 [Acidimicrobiia bacterium]|nr:hypothetical protein [Acidimicrobiia bacterium]MCY4458454.1 hypothetical protein [Acidimicrobiaceae bacterium]